RATGRFAFTILGTLASSSRADVLCDKYEAPGAAPWRADGAQNRFWSTMTAHVRLTNRSPDNADRIQDALAWFARDAMIHLCAPRGLEQSNGGAWGVRDVCQGAVEFLLSYDHGPIVADI